MFKYPSIGKMKYAIELLEKEKKTLENELRIKDTLRYDIKRGVQHLKEIKELKRALKVLKAKFRPNIQH